MSAYLASRVLYVDFVAEPLFTTKTGVCRAFPEAFAIPILSYMPVPGDAHDMLICGGSEAIH